MYGYEAQMGGLGGLAAQVPGGDRYFGSAMMIPPNASALISGPAFGTTLPYNEAPGFGVATPAVRQVDKGPGVGHSPVRDLLDWHSSPAIWVLGLVLLLYAWLHVSVRASASAAGRLG